MSEKRTCTFFGHRSISGMHEDSLTVLVDKVIRENNVHTFWCGGYGEFDALAARTVSKLKKKYSDIELVLVRAYMPKSGEQLSDIYDATIYPEGLENVPKRFAISRRNQWMAQNSDMAITYVNHTFGGAYQAYKTAKRYAMVFNLGELS